jgi:hypothetical protein
LRLPVVPVEAGCKTESVVRHNLLLSRRLRCSFDCDSRSHLA